MEGVAVMESSVLSEKKIKVLETVDRFGAITTAQLNEYLIDLHFNTIYRARKHCMSLGYIDERVYGMRKLVAITDKGAKFIGKNLKGVSLVNNDMYHQLISNQVLLKYLIRYRDERQRQVSFMTERDIITEKQLSMSLDELRQPNRVRYLWKEVPDFILTIDDKVLAFEIELSRKTNRRVEEKLRKYKKEDKYDAVYYICGNDYIRRSVGNVNDGLNAGINFLMLDDVIDIKEV